MRITAIVLAVILASSGTAIAQCALQPPNVLPADQNCWAEEDPGEIQTVTRLANGFTFSNSALSDTPSAAQWQCNATGVEQDKPYRFSFDVIGLPTGQFVVGTAQKKDDPWNPYGVWLVADRNGHHTIEFSCTATDPAARTAFHNAKALGATVTNIRLDDATLCPVTDGVRNGDFDCSPEFPLGWKQLSGALADGATLAVVPGYNGTAAQITLPSTLPADRDPWDVQLGQVLSAGVVEGMWHRLAGWIRGSASDSIKADLNDPANNYANLGLFHTLTLTTVWAPFTLDFQATGTAANPQLAFDCALAGPGVSVALDDVSLAPTLTAVGEGNAAKTTWGRIKALYR